MSYKDKEKQAKAQHEHYLRNKELFNERRRQVRVRMKKWFAEFSKNDKCINCPESDKSCLDYHHVNPSEKDRSIADFIQKYSKIDKVIEEYKKCVCLCSNCHRKFHAGKIQIDFSKYLR